jgi:hypothetical protein
MSKIWQIGQLPPQHPEIDRHPQSTPHQMSQELTTNEVAKLIGVAPDLLRKWKARGFLKHAPAGVAGQGRGVQCLWSEEAIEEARYVAATQQKTKRRTRRP